MRFPMLIHVTYEEPLNDSPFLAVLDDGVEGVHERGQKVAIYRLIQTGTVAITKKFVTVKKRHA